jgi:hypothetical protein
VNPKVGRFLCSSANAARRLMHPATLKSTSSRASRMMIRSYIYIYFSKIKSRLHISGKTHGIVSDVAGSGSEVDDWCRQRAAGGERVHMRHHVMAHAPLFLLRTRKVDVLQIGGHFLQLRIVDCKTKLLQPEKPELVNIMPEKMLIFQGKANDF